MAFTTDPLPPFWIYSLCAALLLIRDPSTFPIVASMAMVYGATRFMDHRVTKNVKRSITEEEVDLSGTSDVSDASLDDDEAETDDDEEAEAEEEEEEEAEEGEEEAEEEEEEEAEEEEEEEAEEEEGEEEKETCLFRTTEDQGKRKAVMNEILPRNTSDVEEEGEEEAEEEEGKVN